MKLHLPKTLLTAVLAVLAVSGTQVTAAESFESITHGGNFWASSYTFSFVLNDVNSNGSVVAAYWGTSSTGDLGSNGFTVAYDSATQTYTLSAGAGKLNDININASTTFTNQANGTNTNTTTSITGLQAGVLYTVTGTATDGNTTVTVDSAYSDPVSSSSYLGKMNGDTNPPNSGINSAYAVNNGTKAIVWKGTTEDASVTDVQNWQTITNGTIDSLQTTHVLVFENIADVSKTIDITDLNCGGINTFGEYTLTTTGTLNVSGSVHISEGGKLELNGDSTASIGNIYGLSCVEGSSDLELTSGTSYLRGGNSEEAKVSTKLTGSLIIKNGATLRLGHPDDTNGGKDTAFIDLSSLDGIELAGGTLASRVFAGSLGDINVTAASTLNFVDINNPDTSSVSIGTLTVGDFEGDRDLTLTSKWKSRVVVDKLTGAGTVWFTCTDGDSSGRKLTVNSVQGFTGKIHIENHNDNKAFLNVTVKDTENLNATQIEASNISEVVINGAGTYNLGSSAYLAGHTASGTTTEKGSLAETWTGKVTLNGTAFTNGDLTKYGKANSTISLAGITGSLAAQTVDSDVIFEGTATANTPAVKLTGEAGSAVKFAGDITGNGNFVLMTTGNAITFSGDVSDWGGRFIASAAETGLVYEGAAKEINNDILTGDNMEAATLNVTFKNTDGVTVNGDINEEVWSDGVVNLVVENASDSATGGVTFNGTIADSVTKTEGFGRANVTVKEGATATFTNGTVYLTNATVETGANLSLTGTEELSLLNLTVKAGATMSVANGNGTVVVAAPVSTYNTESTTGSTPSGVVTLEGGSTITGGLDLSNATTLQLDKMTGTDLVTVTGDLTLPEGTLTLSGDILAKMGELVGGATLDIFSVGGAFNYGGQAVTSFTIETGPRLDTVFANGSSDYYLGYTAPVDGAVGGTVYIGKVIPEPTTATLSLLALAALAARRRRK